MKFTGKQMTEWLYKKLIFEDKGEKYGNDYVDIKIKHKHIIVTAIITNNNFG